MSGGSMDYVYYKIEECERYIPDRELREMTHDFARLMHDLEWYDSGDTGEDDWKESRDKFKKKWFGNRDERLKQLINEAVQELRTELIEMIGTNKEKSHANP